MVFNGDNEKEFYCINNLDQKLRYIESQYLSVSNYNIL